MKDRARKAKLRLWGKITRMPEGRITKTLYNDLKEEGESEWVAQVRSDLKRADLQEMWTKETKMTKEEWDDVVEEKFVPIQKEEARDRLEGAGVKLDRYKRIKSEEGREEYLDAPDCKGRWLLSRMRSGTNGLEVEMGRWTKTAREERTCQLCGTEKEDEEHFMCRCVVMGLEREVMINRIEDERKGKEGEKEVTHTLRRH
jgi:hypothetical protein